MATSVDLTNTVAGALLQSELLGGVLGDGRGDDLLAAVELDANGRHHRAERDLGDGAGELVSGGETHVESLGGCTSAGDEDRPSLDTMKLAAMHLTQRDGVTCGPAVAVVAGALLDPGYRGEPRAGVRWARVVRRRAGPRARRRRTGSGRSALGTTPMGVARAISVHSKRYGVRYGWRWCRGLSGRRDGLADVLAGGATRTGRSACWSGTAIPRHWVLIVERSRRRRCAATSRRRGRCVWSNSRPYGAGS